MTQENLAYSSWLRFKFTSETTGSIPPDDGLENLDRGLVISGVNP